MRFVHRAHRMHRTTCFRKYRIHACQAVNVGLRSDDDQFSKRGSAGILRKSQLPAQPDLPQFRTCPKVYNWSMAKHVIHISEEEAATTNVASLLAHVRAGTEVVIGNDDRPIAVLRAAEPGPGRLLSESIALAEAHAKESGYESTLDPDFAADLEEIINSRQPLNVSTWE